MDTPISQIAGKLAAEGLTVNRSRGTLAAKEESTKRVVMITSTPTSVHGPVFVVEMDGNRVETRSIESAVSQALSSITD